MDSDGLGSTLVVFLGVCLRASYATSLGFNLFLCKLKMLVMPTTGFLGGINEIIPVKYSACTQ